MPEKQENHIDRLPVILVTGFLGSGKTTVLRHWARANPRRRLIFLVNELAETDIDSFRIAGDGGHRPHGILGGSLFCECKAADFISALEGEVLPQHRKQPWDALVIETSGMADPSAIGSLLSLHGLGSCLQLQPMVTVVSPSRFHSLLEHLPVFTRQLQMADRIILNKVDLVDKFSLRKIEEAIWKVHPGVPIERTIQGRATLQIGGEASSHPVTALETCDANPFTAEFLPITNLPTGTVEACLRRCGPALLRAKGSIRTEGEQWMELDWTVDGIESRPGLPRERSGLVCIVLDEDASLLDALAKDLAAADPQARSTA